MLLQGIKLVQLQHHLLFRLFSSPVRRKIPPTLSHQRFIIHTESSQLENQDKMDKKDKKPEPHEKTGDVMSKSFGEGYSTRSEDEGYGGISSGTQTSRTEEVHENHPDYDKSQGSEVKQQEKASFQGIDGSVDPPGYHEEVTQGRPDRYHLEDPWLGLPPSSIPRVAAPMQPASRIASKGSTCFPGEASHGAARRKIGSTSFISREAAILWHQNIDIMLALKDHLEVVVATELGFEPNTAKMIQNAITSC